MRFWVDRQQQLLDERAASGTEIVVEGNRVQRFGGCCAVLGCRERAAESRLARVGHTIGYCHPHARQAYQLFGEG